MSKRGFEKFKRTPQDSYDTPAKAVEPLLQMLGPRPEKFIEPCAGSGALVRALEAAGHRCVSAGDIAPRAPGIHVRDGAETVRMVRDTGVPVITNPPYKRDTAVRLMQSWIVDERPVCLLIPLDWLCNRWFSPFADHLTGILPIGRVKWFEDSAYNSTENYIWAWFEFGLGYPRGASVSPRVSAKDRKKEEA